jgi:asparagine synthase (glutamine-hydrolysing)
MSAITGIYHRDGHFHDKNNIKNMNDCLSHRGPDDSGILCKESIAFGHQMLHTTPESINEKLPYMDEINGLFITSDARIDNRLELSEILNLENAENVPDSLFILKAYEKWGEKCPEKLLGDFAFAIWDKKEEKLFCARDHMGVKPFYYYLSDDIFLFATEKKSILINPDISKELNELRIGFFLKNFLDKESTFYKNISILPPAHSLTIKAHKTKS